METVVGTQEIQNDINDLKEAMQATTDEGRKQKFQAKITELESLLVNEVSVNDPDVIQAEIEIKNPEANNWLVSDNWFTANPDKILGEIEIKTDRYGKQFNAVTGTIQNIDKIKVETVFANDEMNIPATATTETEAPEKEAENPENQTPLDLIIAASEKSVATKTVKKKAKIVDTGSDVIDTEAKLQDLKFIWQKYNPNISKDEFEVFCWYKRHIGQPVSSEWVKT